LLSGILLALCYPKISFNELIWLWPIPLLVSLWTLTPSKKTYLKGFVLAYLSGVVFFVINLSWLHHIHIASCVLLSLFLACYFGVWGAFASTIGAAKNSDHSLAVCTSIVSLKSAFLNGAAWCGLEWVRGWALTGFPWNGLGVGLVDELVLIQIADVIGVTGISFVTIFCSSIITSLLFRITHEIKNSKLKAHPDFIAGVSLVMFLFAYGTSKLARVPKDQIEIRTLLVQGGIDQDEKWDSGSAQKIYKRYWDMTTPYLKMDNVNFDLVVWPESSLPYSLYDQKTQNYLNQILALKNFELVLGINERIPQDGIYNSVVALKNNTKSARTYQKTHLVPFGEYVPFRKSIPLVEKIAANSLGVDFNPGNTYKPLQMTLPEPYQIIPLVCFEDAFGNLARKFINQSPQLIVNVTNDGWFKESAASEQHMANAIFRCIELRRPMIRCANTGMSCLIDDCGSLYDRHSTFSGGERLIHGTDRSNTFLIASLPETIKIERSQRITIYSKVGDLFSIMMGSIALIVCLLNYFQSFRKINQKTLPVD